jgi:hypothetical protein
MKHPDVLVDQVRTTNFYDWDSYLSKYLVLLNKTNPYHIFTVDADRNPDVIYCQTHHGAPEVAQNLVKVAFRSTNWTAEDKPAGILPPGIQDIKWIELWKKWRPLVPEAKRAEFEFYNSEPTKETIAAVKQHTKESKKNRKDRSRTDTQKPPPSAKANSGKK